MTSSIDLEMTIINKDYDSIIDYLCECVTDDNNMIILQECAAYPLLETAGCEQEVKFIEEYNELKKELNNLNGDDIEGRTGVIHKISNYVKRLINWWFKVDPNKKFKNVRLVIKILLAITLFVITFKFSKTISKQIASNILPTSAGAVARKISYKGTNKVLKSLFSAESILITSIRLGYNFILSKLIGTYYDCKDKVNLKDIDSNIDAYENALDKVNGLLCDYKEEMDDKTEKELRKHKNSLENSIAMLTRIKSKHSDNKDDNSGTK